MALLKLDILCPRDNDSRIRRTSARVKLSIVLVWMPCFRGDSHIALVWSPSVLGQRSQRYLIARAIPCAWTPAAVPGNVRSLLDSAAVRVRVVVPPGHSSRANKSARGEDFAEERTKNRAAGCCDCKACLAARPDGDIGGGVEEVRLVAECMDIRNSNDGGDRGAAHD
jgi:hypothetical protein